MSTPCASVNDTRIQGHPATERALVRTAGVANTSQLGRSPSARGVDSRAWRIVARGGQPRLALSSRAMASSTASTVDQYVASLPADRRAAVARVRGVVNARLPRGYQEAMQYGMIIWIVPTSRLAETYNGQPLALASLASHKQYMALEPGRSIHAASAS